MIIKFLSELERLIQKMRTYSKNFYFPFWFRCHDFVICEDDYKKRHRALLKYGKYCDNDIVQRKIRFIEEVQAIVFSLDLHPNENFVLCHMDDLFNHLRSRETPPEYFFCWDCGLITWNFPGNLRGSIYI